MSETSNLSLNKRQKAAALLLSLEENEVSEILKHIDSEVIPILSREMANLGALESEQLNQIYEEFQSTLEGKTGSITGSYEKTQKILSQAFPSQMVEDIMAEVMGPQGENLWKKLENVDEDFLISFLQSEHVQTIAVILTKIHPSKAANILKTLPEDTAQEVLMRVLKLENISNEVMKDLEDSLKKQFIHNRTQVKKKDSYQIMADVFNLFDRDSEKKFFDFLNGELPEEAQKIRDLMFTFEDIAKIDGTGIQEIIRTVDKSKLALALKGTSEKIKKIFFSNMAERAGKLLQEEIIGYGKVRLKDVDEAQNEIVLQTRDLIERGIIVLPDADSEEEAFVE